MSDEPKLTTQEKPEVWQPVLSQEEQQACANLAYRLVVTSHMRQHASLNGPCFRDCREGFCGEWHALTAESEAQA